MLRDKCLPLKHVPIGFTPLVRPGGISALRQVGVHSSILVRQLASLPVGPEACLDSDEWVSTPLSWSDPCLGLVRPGACLDSDEWVSTPPSWSDPCLGLVGPGGISGLRQVGIHSSILV